MYNLAIIRSALEDRLARRSLGEAPAESPASKINTSIATRPKPLTVRFFVNTDFVRAITKSLTPNCESYGSAKATTGGIQGHHPTAALFNHPIFIRNIAVWALAGLASSG
jgi:hypothetical protein